MMLKIGSKYNEENGNEEKYPLDVYDDMFNIEHVLTDDFILSYWTQSHTVDEWNKIIKDYYKKD